MHRGSLSRPEQVKVGFPGSREYWKELLIGKMLTPVREGGWGQESLHHPVAVMARLG